MSLPDDGYHQCRWCLADLSQATDDQWRRHLDTCRGRPQPWDLCANCGLEYRKHRQHGPGCSYFEQRSVPERHPS